MTFVPAHIEVVAPGARPERTALVVHGILGSASNWRGFIRKLVDDPRAAAWRWILADLRCHGDSRGAPPPHTVRACAEDLVRLSEDLGTPFERVYGHSFGGKVALELAKIMPLREAWFFDTSLAARSLDELQNYDVAQVIRACREMSEPLPGRAEVADHMRAAGLSEGLAQWMTTNVRGTQETGYFWRFDLGGIEALLRDYVTLDLESFAAHPPAGLTIQGVRGGRSDRFTSDDLTRMEMLGIPIDVLPKAGHWVHVDDPAGLAKLMLARL